MQGDQDGEGEDPEAGHDGQQVGVLEAHLAGAATHDVGREVGDQSADHHHHQRHDQVGDEEDDRVDQAGHRGEVHGLGGQLHEDQADEPLDQLGQDHGGARLPGARQVDEAGHAGPLGDRLEADAAQQRSRQAGHQVRQEPADDQQDDGADQRRKEGQDGHQGRRDGDEQRLSEAGYLWHWFELSFGVGCGRKSRA